MPRGSAELPGPPPTALVANLPYNVAVPVLLHLLATFPSIGRGLVMVQAEVADRMSAAPGSRVYGVPSVKLAWFAEVRRAGSVPRSVFWPVPRVDSGLVAFTRRDPPVAAASGPGPGPGPGAASGGQPSRAEVFAVVDAAFAQRRKTLRAALAPWAGSPAAAELVLREAGIDPGLRGESLGVAEFARIALPAAASPHSRSRAAIPDSRQSHQQHQLRQSRARADPPARADSGDDGQRDPADHASL